MFTRPHDFLNPYDVRSSVEHKRRSSGLCSLCFIPYSSKVGWDKGLSKLPKASLNVVQTNQALYSKFFKVIDFVVE